MDLFENFPDNVTDEREASLYVSRIFRIFHICGRGSDSHTCDTLTAITVFIRQISNPSHLPLSD